MNRNIGSFDKVLRRTLGCMILGLGFHYQSWLGIIGLLPIALSYWNHCPLYVPLKINTRKGEENA